MYKLLSVAILSVFFIVGILLFAPGTHKRPKNIRSAKLEERKKQTNIFQSDNSNTANNESLDFSSSDNSNQSKNKALSRGMNEKFFAYFDKNQYHTMKMNLREKMTSHADSIVKSKKAHKSYDTENDI